MWNPETNRDVVTRDVIWLRHMFFEKHLDTDNFETESGVEAGDTKDKGESEEHEFEAGNDNEEVEDQPVQIHRVCWAEQMNDQEPAAGANVVSAAVSWSGLGVKTDTRLIERMNFMSNYSGTSIKLKYLWNRVALDNFEIV